MSVEHPSATIEHLLVAQGSSDFYTYPIPIAKFDVQDNHMVPNARHGGQTTLADVRCSEYVKKEDEIANLQSITVAESSQLDEIA